MGQFLIDHVLAIVANLRAAHRTVDGLLAPCREPADELQEFIEDWVVKQFADQFRAISASTTLVLAGVHRRVDVVSPRDPPRRVELPVDRVVEPLMPECPPRSGCGWRRSTRAGTATSAGTGMSSPRTCATATSRPPCRRPCPSPATCSQLPIVRAAGVLVGAHTDAAPLTHVHDGLQVPVLPEPCRWIFTQRPERFAGHQSLIDRVLSGEISPPDLGTVLEYFRALPGGTGPRRRRLRVGEEVEDTIMALLPLTARSRATSELLIPVDDGDTVESVGRQIAHHVVGRRVARREALIRLRHNGSGTGSGGCHRRLRGRPAGSRRGVP